jgi:hypothetical protein
MLAAITKKKGRPSIRRPRTVLRRIRKGALEHHHRHARHGADATALQQLETGALLREQFEGAGQQTGEGEAEDQRFQGLDGGGFERHGRGFQRMRPNHGARSFNAEAKL